MPSVKSFTSLRSLIESIKPARRILLINPPVHETNYRWLQWNQPLDLLKLGNWLRKGFGTDVKLFDFLAPDRGGKPPRHKLDRQWDIHGVMTDAWHFGRPLEDLRKTLTSWLQKSRWSPDAIIVTTMTSYWVSGLYGLLPKLRNLGGPYKEVPIAVIGNLPRYAPRQAELLPGVTHLSLSKDLPSEIPAALDLYQSTGVQPAFAGLDANSPSLVEEVRSHIANEITTFTFFNEEIFGPASQLQALAGSGVVNAKKISFHILCGAKPSQLTDENLQALRRLGIRTMCVDYETDAASELLVDHYARIRDFTIREAFLRQEGSLTGFINFGLPGEDFDRVVYHTLLLNKWMGSIILKPFGVLWDDTSESIRDKKWPRPEDQSPHSFPYLEENKVQVEDYFNLYRWQALLNYKNRGATFDLLSNTALGRTVRSSVLGESWTLENIIKEGERATEERRSDRAALPPARL